MADSLVQRIRCTVYDKDNNYLGYVDAPNAKLDIDPNTVREKIDNLLEVIDEQLGIISKAVTNEAQPDAANSLVVVDTDTQSLFDQVEEILTDGSIKETLSGSLEDAYSTAVQRFNEIQEGYNEAAREAAKQTKNYNRYTETNITG